jgi:hypothetical protein
MQGNRGAGELNSLCSHTLASSPTDVSVMCIVLHTSCCQQASKVGEEMVLPYILPLAIAKKVCNQRESTVEASRKV